MTIDPSAEILRLRATVRDLLALSTIPEAWVGREPSAIATDLAEACQRIEPVPDGREAVRRLLDMGYKAGIIPREARVEFV